MKKIWNFSAALLCVAIFIGCQNETANEKLKEIEQKLAECESQPKMQRTDCFNSSSKENYKKFGMQVDQELDAIIIATKIDGHHFYSEGSKPGMNIEAKLDANRVVISLVGIKTDGSIYTAASYELTDGGPALSVQLKPKDDVNNDPQLAFEIKSGIELANMPKVASDDIKINSMMDLKIVQGGGNTGGSPAIVGANDARELHGDKQKGEALHVITDWNKGEVLYITYKYNSGDDVHSLTFHSSEGPKNAGAQCFWSYGQVLWGKGFSIKHVGC